MFYACTYKDGKYGIADSSDATIEWLDYEALKNLLEEHPKLKVFGVTLSEREQWMLKYSDQTLMAQ